MFKLKKNIKYIYIILSIIVLILIILYINNIFKSEPFENTINTISYFEENSEKHKNPYIKNETNSDLNDVLWQKIDSEFMKQNWPNTFDFDYDIKEDIINKALTLPQNSCIIDCGAHIGDGSVSIAHALKYHKREDIIIYAIDPSKFKCDFINFIKNKNNLNNLKVLNYGLSNINSEYKTLKQSGENTGGWEWVEHTNDNTNTEDMNNINKFIKLDDLVKDNIIKETIGIIHLDVEGMEKNAIIGGFTTIEKYKPYLSIENNIKTGQDENGKNHSLNNKYYLEFLPKGYNYIYNKGENNIFIYE